MPTPHDSQQAAGPDPDLQASTLLSEAAAGTPDAGPTGPSGETPGAGAGPAPERYRPVRLHAQGNLGEVHVARDVELGREVALKRIQARYRDQPGFADLQRRFLREAEITGRLEHPGVVPVYGLVRDADGQPCYAMRFIEGETLHEAIRRFHAQDGAGGHDRLAFRELLGRLVAVCQTVAYAHVSVHWSRVTSVQEYGRSSEVIAAWTGRIPEPISSFGVAKISAKTTGVRKNQFWP
jgi:hypothetical protein